MHRASVEALAHFDAGREVLRRASDATPADLMRRRPDAGRWSVAEILAHVAIVERRVTQLLRTSVESASTTLGTEADLGAIVPSVNVERLRDRTRRIVASEATQPPSDADPDRAWRELSESHDALTQLLADFDGMALSKVVLPNPVLGPLNVYQWVVFLGGHEARHAEQIHEAVRVLSVP